MMPYPYYQNPYYPQPMQDNLAQLRQNMMQPQPMMQPQQQPMQSSVVWISGGEAEANGYMVAPNTSVILMSSNANTFYTKSRDASGTPSPLRIFDYTERTCGANSPAGGTQTDTAEFVTRKEFEALAAVVGAMKGQNTEKEAAGDGE